MDWHFPSVHFNGFYFQLLSSDNSIRNIVCSIISLTLPPPLPPRIAKKLTSHTSPKGRALGTSIRVVFGGSIRLPFCNCFQLSGDGQINVETAHFDSPLTLFNNMIAMIASPLKIRPPMNECGKNWQFTRQISKSLPTVYLPMRRFCVNLFYSGVGGTMWKRLKHMWRLLFCRQSDTDPS